MDSMSDFSNVGRHDASLQNGTMNEIVWRCGRTVLLRRGRIGERQIRMGRRKCPFGAMCLSMRSAGGDISERNESDVTFL